VFFQTGFVETLCPQFTPGLVLTSPSIQTQRTPQTSFVDPIEHEGLRAQVKDLTEKLETVRSECMMFFFCIFTQVLEKLGC